MAYKKYKGVKSKRYKVKRKSSSSEKGKRKGHIREKS